MHPLFLLTTMILLAPLPALPVLVQLLTFDLLPKTNSDEQIVLEQLNIHMQKENFNPYLTRY